VGYANIAGHPVSRCGVTHFGTVSFLLVEAAEWGNPPNWGNQITAPKPAKSHGRTTWLPTVTSVASYFDDFNSKTAKNADEIDSAGDNLSVESDSKANQRNQTEVLLGTTTLKRKAAPSEQTKKTNVGSLFVCVLSDRAIAFWTSPRVPGVACKDSYFFTTGR